MQKKIYETILQIGERCVERSFTVATAESCTAGLLSAALTEVPGSSRWFVGGVTSYSNEIKERVLQVPAAILESHGAVSEETVRDMAKGVVTLMHADVAVAISGIAGPDGGSVEKPVGTVCIAVLVDGMNYGRTVYFSGDRAAVREQTVAVALDILLRRLGGVPGE